MRSTILMLLTLVSLAPSLVAQEPLKPQAAAKQIGKTVSVQFVVQSQGRNGQFAELHSKKKWNAPGNFFVRLTADTQKELREAGVSDIAGHFAAETIVATGKVEQLNFPDGKFPVIRVLRMKDIRVVSAPGNYTPTADYIPDKSYGFELRFHPEFKKRRSEREIISKEISKQLRALSRALPKDKVKFLRTVPIWVEWNSIPDKGAMFHPNRKWLKENGMNPDKVHGVEISSADNFMKWSRDAQPCILMHELAHAYHNKALSFENPDVKQAFQNAVDTRSYLSVAYVKGGKKKAYAVTNEMEYFAEATESYFGKNDFFPFTRRDLKRHDPVGYAMIEKMWSRPLSKSSEAKVQQ